MKIGLTGGIGCGKSTVGRLLEDAGFCRSDSDEIVRDLLRSDEGVVSEVIGHFGEGICADGGGIDRSKLAKIVFNDDSTLKWLESLLHPRVGEIWRARLATQAKQNSVVEIPLLFEKNLENAFDFVVCVFCTREQQLTRLASKGINRQMALARISNQLPLNVKTARADISIFNNGSLDFLKRQTVKLLDVLN
ncbi:dephospho-CoA kinase [Rubellicoccus peritrichatus]|uniref:Dephospho-CoA kinase n=1 Tax=Rubellicoccus peritrichatus TaxID=3080537 RepID=A0AAQ3LC82_9BACT|nr:dephospho-CoA kinase [Puniceicoccus sp. CR14]WOO42980.1 dephospho-CoA kinase [Puniceicoccus sp. CR14]